MELVCIDFLSKSFRCSKDFVGEEFYSLRSSYSSTFRKGRDFECQFVSDMLTTLGVKKSRTSPYHPQGDSQPERFNRTLLNMLGTLEPSQKSK